VNQGTEDGNEVWVNVEAGGLPWGHDELQVPKRMMHVNGRPSTAPWPELLLIVESPIDLGAFCGSVSPSLLTGQINGSQKRTRLDWGRVHDRLRWELGQYLLSLFKCV